MYIHTEENNMNVINDLIRELMYQQNKTIKDVCDDTGLPWFTVKSIVDYDISPTPDVADVILRCLGESLEEVLGLY